MDSLGITTIITVLATWHVFNSFLTLSKDHGIFRALILLFLFPDAREVMDRIEKHLLRSDPKNAMIMKKALADDCTMLAVAAAIVAQIAITALSLGDSDTIHWTANAAFVVSLVAASLSVFYACLLQQHVSSLFTPEDVKSWLSRPASPAQLLRLAQQIPKRRRQLRGQQDDPESATQGSQSEELRKKVEHFAQEFRWKTASFNAAFMIKVPSLLLNWSVSAFLIGLGIYLGCLWIPDTSASRKRDGSLGVLLFYIATTIGGLLLYFVPAACKFLEMLPIKRLDMHFNRKRDPTKPRFEAMFKSTDATVAEHPEEHPRSHIHLSNSFVTQRAKPSATDVANKLLEGGSKDVAQKTTNDVQIRDQIEKPIGEITSLNDTSSKLPVQCDPLIAALKASVEAQEQSTAALKAVLNAHLATSATDRASNDQVLTNVGSQSRGLDFY
ncbi:hypothetical protein D6D06_09183 [Aureobasidium pullulans]|nr:hypothetical protein D6D06_09183 [Aureobasidium pullulans]